MICDGCRSKVEDTMLLMALKLSFIKPTYSHYNYGKAHLTTQLQEVLTAVGKYTIEMTRQNTRAVNNK